MKEMFKALEIFETPDGKFGRRVRDFSVDELPAGDVLIKVDYSSLNFKDALSAIGNRGITKRYPHVPGIDASGVVAESSSDKFKVGDKVIVTGRDLGMDTHGGFSQYIRVPADWVVALPENLTLREAMIFGTAGFTAAACVEEITSHDILPEHGKVLVTGATGGVGSFAVSMLARLGYEVTASTTKPQEKEYLNSLGATEIIAHTELNGDNVRGLLPRRWVAAVDTVGGRTLNSVLKSLSDRGVVVNCGMVESPELHTHVFPFVIRAVKLIGVASAETPYPQRLKLWDRLASDLKLADLERFVHETNLEDLSDEINKILRGGQRGRALVKLWQ
ncbi:MAG: YhdH/YhfP family quinone oxidoreductase [Chloroflexota bacterium]